MMKYDDLWYESSDGLRLYARDYSMYAKPDAPVIVCIHGLTRSSGDFRVFCEQYCSDYRVYAVDVRGRGRSDYDHDSSNYHVFTYADDLRQFFEHLNLESVLLVGTSMGGLISFAFAGASIDNVSGIVLNDIGPEVSSVGVARIIEYVSTRPKIETWEQAVAETKRINEGCYPEFTSDDWYAFTRNLYRENDQGLPVLNYDEHIADLFNAIKPEEETPTLWPTFDTLKSIPFLVFRGEFSDILDTHCVKRMCDEHPQLTFVEVASRGHTPLLNEPECETALTQFFKGLV